MEFVDAFLLATAFAYFACLFCTLMGKSPLIGVDDKVQGILYGLASVIFVVVSIGPSISTLNFILGVFYGFSAVGSFIGWPQQWSAFWEDDPEEGSAAGQIGMAFWDLVIAICCFMKFTL